MSLARQPFSPAMLCCVVLALELGGCLPNPLTDNEIQARIAAAQADAPQANPDATTQDSAADSLSCPMSDPAKGVCQDKSTDLCDGCVDCKVRTVLDVHKDSTVASRDNMDAWTFDAKTPFSVEAWLSIQSSPPVGLFATAVAASWTSSLVDKKQVIFALGAARDASGTHLGCILSDAAANSVVVGAATSIAVGSWHHVRCSYTPKTGTLQASLDGQTPLSANGTKLGAILPANTKFLMLVGQVPADISSKTSPFIGYLDEVRILVGSTADANIAGFQYRYKADEPDTLALYHMDMGTSAQTLSDAGPYHYDADQTTFKTNQLPKFRTDTLPTQPESCYGYNTTQATCAAKAPWCK